MKFIQVMLVAVAVISIALSVQAQTLTSPPVARISTVYGPFDAVTPQNPPDESQGEFTFFSGDSSVSGISRGRYGNGVEFFTSGKAAVCGGVSANIQPTHGRIRVLSRGLVEWITSEAISSSDPAITLADTITGVNAFGSVKLFLQAPANENLELIATAESQGSALEGAVLTGVFFDRRPLTSPVFVEQNVPLGIVSSAAGAEGAQQQSAARIIPAGTTTQFDFRVGATTFPFAKENRGTFETMLTLDYGGCDLQYVSGTDLGAASTWSPPRVPYKDDAGCGNLLIDNSATLDLQFGTVQANALAIRRATVTLSGGLLSLAGFSEGPELVDAPQEIGAPGLDAPCTAGVQEHINNRLHFSHPSFGIGNGGALFLETGTYDLFSINVGDLAGSEAILILDKTDAVVNVAANIIVGDAAPATLSVNQGRLTTELGDIILGNSETGNARMNVGGPENADAVVACKRLLVGGKSVSRLNISEGGIVNCESSRVGVLASAESEIVVQVSGALNITNAWEIGFGSDGFGKVLAQGKVNCGALTVGVVGPGKLHIADSESLVNVAGDALVGQAEKGEIRLTQEGRLRVVGDLIAGNEGSALVELNDAILDALADIQIGNGEFALLSADASIVNAVNIDVGGPSSGRFDAKGSSEINAAALRINTNGELIVQDATINVAAISINGRTIVRETPEKQGNAPNALNGDVAFGATAATILELSGGTAAPLAITGNAILNGALEVRFSDNAVLSAGQNIELVQFGQPPSGAFSNITFPTRSSDFQAETNFNNGQLLLNIIQPGTAVIPEGETEPEGENIQEGEPVEGEGEGEGWRNEGEGEGWQQKEGEGETAQEGEPEGENEEAPAPACGCRNLKKLKDQRPDFFGDLALFLLGIAMLTLIGKNKRPF